MRGRERLNPRKLRFLVSSSRVRAGRGVDSLTPSIHQLLIWPNRVSTGDDDNIRNRVTTFWKNVRTGVLDEGLRPHPPPSAWINRGTHTKPLWVLTSAPAASDELEILSNTATGLAHAGKIRNYHLSPLPYSHHATCSPRMSASFATLRQQVKTEVHEEEVREQERGACDKSRDQGEDTHTSFEKALTKDTETSSGFGRIEPNYVDEKDTVAEECRGNLAWSGAGWTREEVWNWPNFISMTRLLSGPVLAWMILQELWSSALVGLIVAGISDWLDGYVARRMEINSVLGSYLDPVADKVLVGSVALSMAYAGLLHRHPVRHTFAYKAASCITNLRALWAEEITVLISATTAALVGLVVARDGVLVGGAFLYRAYSLRWQWSDWREFFRINVGGAGKVQPLYISKVNTVLQLGLIGVALVQPALSMEDTYSLVPLLSWSVAGTTTISWACYVYQYLKNPGSLAALKHVPQTHSDKKSSKK